MTILIFVVAVVGGLVLDRQERRQRYEKRKEYERLGWDIPVPKPKLSMLESWANIVLGLTLFVPGILFLRMVREMPDGFEPGRVETQAALFLASGFALVWLGAKALKQNRDYTRHPGNHRQSRG